MNARNKIGPKRIGFISTRIAGTDGVSLEIGKWERILEEKMGISCYFITGESDRPADRTYLIEEAHFNHPEVLEITRQAFTTERRTAELTQRIIALMNPLRQKLTEAIRAFNLDGVIAENCLTIPMNIPLGVALVEVIQEMGMGCLAHHHDFYWERERFLVNCVNDFLTLAFPPPVPQIQHVVINSLAAEDFSRRTGLSCRIIPNVMDFSSPPPPPDDFARSFRQAIGLKEGELLILQPTRVVARKGIEHSIELIRRLGPTEAKLVITHSAGDEGHEYKDYIREFADLMNVELIFADSLISDQRHVAPDGRRLFTLEDVYSQADLVAYPSEYEGFGNAFLEAVYYKRPIFCNRYAIYRTDIEPCGFRSVLFEGFLTKDTVAQVRRVFEDAAFREAMVEHNYEVAAMFFGYDTVEEELTSIIRRPQSFYRVLARVAERAAAAGFER